MKFSGTDSYVATDDLNIAVNAAITLERPLLVKGEPGHPRRTRFVSAFFDQPEPARAALRGPIEVCLRSRNFLNFHLIYGFHRRYPVVIIIRSATQVRRRTAGVAAGGCP